jgi:hypothetical protein
MVVADKELSPEEKNRVNHRGTSYHEAGHAVVIFLFGTGREIINICMIDDGDSRARVRRKSEFNNVILGMPKLPQATATVWEHLRRKALYREIMIILAGPASKSRVQDTTTGDWFLKLVGDEESWRDGSDLAKAADISFDMGRNARQTNMMLRRLAKWADELMSIPRVWGTVTALAESLEPDVTMSGEDACRIMREAWGYDDDSYWPIESLGRKWIRRLLY